MTKNTQKNLEIETKFLVRDIDPIRQKLIDLGAKLKKDRVYERNIRFDNAWDGLMLQRKLLRLRQDTRARLTFKGELQQPVESEARVRKELEMEVEDFETAAAILELVGFEPKQIYEKYRETFELGRVEVVLDDMPFGDFVELEGEEDDIRETARVLGLNWNHRILDNYLTIMDQLKNEHHLPFNDLTFDNFSQGEILASSILEFSG
jgi:adenylate cyclase class 2